MDTTPELPQFSRWPLETRIELPELSYEEELLATPVPFSHRVQHLSHHILTTEKWLSIADIAHVLDANRDSVKKIVRGLGAEKQITRDGGPAQYEPYTVEVVHDELEWQMQLEKLGAEVSVSDLKHALGRSRRWVMSTLAGLNIYPRPGVLNGRRALLFDKSAAEKLRIIWLHQLPATAHYSISELQELTGKDHRWIERRLGKHGVDAELRINLTSSEPTPHYPLESLDVLADEIDALPEPAGTWLTVGDIAHETGREVKDVRYRLRAYATLAQPRLANNGRAATHYPPEIVHQLNALKDEPTYSYEEIAQLVGRSVHWVMAAAAPFRNQAVMTKVDGKKGKRFNQAVVDTIAEQVKAAPPVGGGWLTVEDITRMLPRHRSWVVRRLEQVAVQSEVRLDVRMKPRTHYEPDTVDELQRVFLIDEENSET